MRRGPPCAQLRPGAGPHLRRAGRRRLVTWAWPGWLRRAQPGPGTPRRRDAGTGGGRRQKDGRLGRDLHPLTMFEGRFSKLLQKLAFWGSKPQVRAAGEGRVGNLVSESGAGRKTGPHPVPPPDLSAHRGLRSQLARLPWF